MSSEETVVNPEKAAPAKRPTPVLSGEQITLAFRQIGDRLSKIETDHQSVSAIIAGLTPDNKENVLILVNDIRTVHQELHALIAFLGTILEADGKAKMEKIVKEAGAQ